MFHVRGEGLLVLPYHISARVAYLVYHAYLGLGLGENVFNGIGEPVKVVGGRDQDVLGATGLDICKYGHPEGGGFVLAEPEAEHLLFPVPAQPHGHVDRLVYHFGAFAHLEDDTVHPHDKVDRFQRAVLPG